MNLSRFFVQTEAQGTLTPGAPLVRGNNQVGLPARRTNLPNVTKVVNIKLENIAQWAEYFQDMGITTYLNRSFGVVFSPGSPVNFGVSAGSEINAESTPVNFAGMRLSPSLQYNAFATGGYGRPVIGPDGEPVIFDKVIGIAFRVAPNEYGMEYGAAGKNSAYFQRVGVPDPIMKTQFYFDDYVDSVFLMGGVTREAPVGDGAFRLQINPTWNLGYNDAWGTLELTIFGS